MALHFRAGSETSLGKTVPQDRPRDRALAYHALQIEGDGLRAVHGDIRETVAEGWMEGGGGARAGT